MFERKIFIENKKLVLLRPFVTDLIDSFKENETIRKNIRIIEDFYISDNFEYLLDPVQFARVLTNLFNNSIKYCERDPIITIRIWNEKELKIEIKDNGDGIPTKIKDKIFQPFFTTKPTGEGTGLGLSMSYDIVTKGHGGLLEVETKEGGGTEFRISIPN